MNGFGNIERGDVTIHGYCLTKPEQIKGTITFSFFDERKQEAISCNISPRLHYAANLTTLQNLNRFEMTGHWMQERMQAPLQFSVDEIKPLESPIKIDRN